jgi:transposase-like protein
MSDVPAYLDREHGIEVSRQTVYNWVKKGVRGTTLQTIRKGGKLYTTEARVDDFVANLDR